MNLDLKLNKTISPQEKKNFKEWDDLSIQKVSSHFHSGIWGEEEIFERDSFPIIRSTEITHDSEIDVSNVAFRTVSKSKIYKYLLETNDLLIVSSSGSSKLFGRTAFFEQPTNNRQYLFSNFLLRLRPINIDPHYLYYVLNSHFYKIFLNSFQKTTTGLRNFPKDDFLRFTIPVPHPYVQEKIVSILLHIDDLIKQSKNIVEKYIYIKNALMDDLFPKFNDSTNKFNEKKLIGFVIGSGSTPRGGNKVYITHGIPFIRSQNVHFEGLHFDGIVYINKQIHDKMKTTKIKPRDILLNITGASLGRCSFVPDTFEEGNVNQHVCIIRTFEDVNSEYLFYYFSTFEFQKYINILQAGSSRQGLSKQEIEKISVFVPSPTEQKKIAKILHNVDVRIQSEKKYIKKLLFIKKGLIKSLLSNEVEVNV